VVHHHCRGLLPRKDDGAPVGLTGVFSEHAAVAMQVCRSLSKLQALVGMATFVGFAPFCILQGNIDLPCFHASIIFFRK